MSANAGSKSAAVVLLLDGNKDVARFKVGKNAAGFVRSMGKKGAADREGIGDFLGAWYASDKEALIISMSSMSGGDQAAVV